MALNYGYTCPDIDREINSFKDAIKSYLSDMLDECNPMMEGEQKELFIKSYANDMYRDFENNFEGVRKVNEDMRIEADRQIERCENDLGGIRVELEEVNIEVDSLHEQIRELESEISETKNV